MKSLVYSVPALLIVILATGCQSPLAAPAAPATAGDAGLLPIQVGAYVAEDKRCGDREPLFHYDGRSMGWSGGGRAERPMYPIRRVREQDGQWVATIVAPGPGVAPEPRELDVFFVPRGGGRIVVTAMERAEMKLCAPEELPAAARGRRCQAPRKNPSGGGRCIRRRGHRRGLRHRGRVPWYTTNFAS